MPTPSKPTVPRWLFLLPIPALWCIANVLGWLDFAEHKSEAWRFRARGEIEAPVEVVYVDIDAKSIADLGNTPWDRRYFAEVCAGLLEAGQVRAIGVDLVFSEKGQPELADLNRFREGNRAFAQFLFSQPPVVLAAAYAAADDRDINGNPIRRELPKPDADPATVQPPELPEFRVGAAVWNPARVGLIDTMDGATREVPAFVQTTGRTYYHMAAELAQLWWGCSVYERDGRLIFVTEDETVKGSVDMTPKRTLEVNWFSRWDSPQNPRASFSEVLTYSRMLRSQDSKEVDAARAFFAQLNNAVVLIGPVDPLLQDLATTPFDDVPVPRVGIHGNLLKTIVTGRSIGRLAPLGQSVTTFLLALGVCGLAAAGGMRSARNKIFGGAVLIGYVGLAFYAFARHDFILPLTAPLGAAFTTSFAAIGWQLLREEKQKSRIKGMFGTYVSPELVNRMVESGEEPKLGGAEVEITAFFSDIQDFSAYAEELTPPQLVELMNEYLSACTDVVTAQGGTLDKYIGDAVVAMFGAPVALDDHAYRACVAAQLIQQRLAELRSRWEANATWSPGVSRMHTRIGLNTGPAVVGNIGSRTRFNYTMMGDDVNLAARLESAAKSYGAGTLVTESTKQAAERSGDRCVFRYIDKIVVKGRSRPVSIFELVGLRETLTPQLKEFLALFGAGMERYLQQDWTGASELFRRSAELESARALGATGVTPSSVFVERCATMAANPPPKEWDGVFVMQTK